MYVYDILPQSQVKEKDAWYKLVDTVPGSQAFRPASQSTCDKTW